MNSLLKVKIGIKCTNSSIYHIFRQENAFFHTLHFFQNSFLDIWKGMATLVQFFLSCPEGLLPNLQTNLTWDSAGDYAEKYAKKYAVDLAGDSGSLTGD